MRYVVTFFDRSSRRVDEKAAAAFRHATESKAPVDYRGCRYAGSSVVPVKPLHDHEQELRDEAAESGLFRCRYGRTHPAKADCACRDAGFARVLEAEEERFLLEEGGGRPALAASARLIEQDAKTLGFTDAKLLREAPSWTKAGDVRRPPAP